MEAQPKFKLAPVDERFGTIVLNTVNRFYHLVFDIYLYRPKAEMKYNKT